VTAFVKAGQFSRGKEMTKQWNYYVTIASFTLFHKRLGKDRHVNLDVSKRSRRTLFILEYFQICFYFHGHQKGAHSWQMGAIQEGATELCG